MQDLHAQMWHQLLDRGPFIQYASGEFPPYGYTVGRWLTGEPEYLVSGLSADDTHALLGHLLHDGTEILPHCPALPSRMALMLYERPIVSTPALGALALFGEAATRVEQVVWYHLNSPIVTASTATQTLYDLRDDS
ncbi:DUF4262 domain-containing protein [Nocardioides sp. TRM66260-LWL]|uniref:DUF4262 domain-containing protein n=1 Tax=Nocardioides sp. TRM66260-LWL TaxID=2874478 RepID=UPI001CC73A9F|nr:DUF4262 domain-containing protein [Nocardioides sp. TRM66260-LWL]MBZ5734074.1 DUF4262 domain-containing protein [Nocardioides sp. TRM66260-LWL]